MFRILFIIILLAVIYFLIKSFKRRKKLLQHRTIKKNKMVKCSHCGLHIPENEATLHKGKNYCSLEHANQNQDIDH